MLKNGLSDLMNESVVRASSVDDSSGMRPEAQLSDPINWDTSLYDKVFWEDIRHAFAISPELWIGLLGGKLSPNPRVIEAPET